MGLTVDACRRYLDAWFERTYDDPIEGRKYADRGLRMVEKLGNPIELQALARAVQGASFFAIGRHDRAEELFEKALTLYRQTDDLPLQGSRESAMDEGDLYRRMSFLRMEQHRYDEALDLLHRAIAIFKAAKNLHELGRAFIARGLVELKKKDSRAIHSMTLGMARMDAEKCPAYFHYAAHNLLLALTIFDPQPEVLETALELLNESRLSPRSRRPSRRNHRRQLLGRRRCTVPDAKARFLQGRILVMLQQHDEARRLLETAREDLIELGMPFDVAAVSVELAECYLWLTDAHRWQRIAWLASEALALLAPLPEATESVAAFELLQHAVRMQSLRETRRRLEGCRVGFSGR